MTAPSSSSWLYQARCDYCGALTPWVTNHEAITVANRHGQDRPSHANSVRVTKR